MSFRCSKAAPVEDCVVYSMEHVQASELFEITRVSDDVHGFFITSTERHLDVQFRTLTWSYLTLRTKSLECWDTSEE